MNKPECSLFYCCSTDSKLYVIGNSRACALSVSILIKSFANEEVATFIYKLLFPTKSFIRRAYTSYFVNSLERAFYFLSNYFYS